MWLPVGGHNWPKSSRTRHRDLLDRAVIFEAVPGVDRYRWRRRLQRDGVALCRDAEAFLTGRLAERLAGGAASSVPAWAWTNLLAHGTEADLGGAAARVQGGRVHGERRWRQARSYLAAEVLEEARSYGSLARLQSDVLVPLELDLATRGDVVAWWPAQWVGVVERALHQAQRARCQ